LTRFTAQAGGRWGVDLTVGLAEKLKADADLDLDELARNPEAVARTFSETPARTAQVLWALCEEEAEKRGVSPHDFGRVLDRPTLDRGLEAFLEEFVLFYPRSSAGRAIRGKLPELLKRMDAEIAERVAAEVDRNLSATATGSPGSSASTPAG
jgi:hypothetical protein